MTLAPEPPSTRLRRLTVTGFKTFARRTEVLLDPGVTAVVGPNGSGKSNLVDAIRWALGETSARELRGLRMDEIIHSGGEGRAPLGMASVDLVLDNEAGRLPVEDAEVSISRRITRHGDSEYRLNGARARLRDVERLLGATGLTQTGYSVVAQNDVDSIIEATPAQRRSLVEEAAGVRGLRTARDDAIERVSATEVRLLRLADLLADAEPRLHELAEQAQVALEQRTLATRLAELRGSLARESWRSARAHARRARTRLAAAQGRAGAAAAADAGFGIGIETERARLAAAQEALAAATRRLELTRLAAERAAGDLRRLDERATEAGLQRAAAGAEESRAVAALESSTAAVAELAGAGSDATVLLDTLTSRRGQLAAAERQAVRLRAEAERAHRLLAAELDQAQRRHADARARAHGHATRAALLDENAAVLANAAAAAAGKLDELVVAAAAATLRSDELEAEGQAASRRAQASRGEAGAARERLAELEAEHAVLVRVTREAEARAAGLRRQVEVSFGGGAVAAAVTTGELAGARLVDTFRVLDTADAAAVEAALEAHLGSFVVLDLDAAIRILAGRSGGAREAVLDGGPVTPASADAAPLAGARRALDAVGVEPEAAALLGRLLAGVHLIPDLASAKRALAEGASAAVLPDGTVVTSTGVRGGGRPGEALAMAATEREAQAALAHARASAAGLAGRVAEAQALAAATTATAEADGVRAEAAHAAAAEAAGMAAAATVAVTADRDHGAALLAEQVARETAAATARAAAEVAEAEATGAATNCEDTAAREAAARARLDGAVAAAEAAASASRDHELGMARAEPRAREVQRHLAAARDVAAGAAERSRAAALRLVTAEDAAVAAMARGYAAWRRVAASAEALATAEATMAAAAAPVAPLEGHVRRLEAERSEVVVAAARASDELVAAEAEVMGAEARVTELAEAVREDEQDDGPEPDAAGAERVEREITRLERRSAALGPVNGLAPEQHGALAQRVGRLRHDHDDLSTACIDLRLLADHLAMEIGARFDAVFGAVAYHFRLLFEELFAGGRATLRLEMPAEADGHRGPAGVEILAQPAGKRLQNLALLSGGERALTALAVILALQQVNPSPFYVFDEVDAPLDDANIGRFTRLLRRLAQGQQFLVVTHNHATMAAADALYGVTMGGDGISRLISVRLAPGGPAVAANGAAADQIAS